jgi:hypothetical protein
LITLPLPGVRLNAGVPLVPGVTWGGAANTLPPATAHNIKASIAALLESFWSIFII